MLIFFGYRGSSWELRREYFSSFIIKNELLIHTRIWWKLKTSAQFSHSVMSDSLQPHGLQHVRPPCPSPTPRVYSNPCPSNWWCHPVISSSVVPFSCCPQSLPASGLFPMSQLFTWGGQSIRVLASASVLPMNTQDWSPLGWTGRISFQSKGLSESSPTVKNIMLHKNSLMQEVIYYMILLLWRS